MSDAHLEILISAKDITSGAFGSARKGISKLSGAVFSLQSAMVGIGAGVAVKQLWDAGIKAEKLSIAFQSIQGDAVRGANSLEFVRETSERLGVEFWEVAGAYKGILAASKGTILEGQGVRDVFAGITEAGVALKLSSEEVEGTLRAVQQMMSKGKVQAEELRGQLGERLPGAFKLAADSMGITTAQLDKMLEDGKVLADDLLPKLAKTLHEKYGKAAADASNSATAKMARFKDEWMDLKVELAQSGFMDVAVDMLGDLTSKLKDMGDWVSENREDVEAFFKTSAGLIKSLGSAAVSTIEAAAELTQWLSDISAAAGMASAGLISITDIPLDADGLRSLVKSFDLDPAIVRLESQKNEIEKKLKGLARDFKTLDKEFDKGLITKNNGAREKLKEDLGLINIKIRELKETSKNIKLFEEQKKDVDDFSTSLNEGSKNIGAFNANYKQLQEVAAKKYDTFVLSKMDKNTKEYQKKFINAEMAKWKTVKGITEDQLGNIEDVYKQSFTKDLAKEFEQAYYEATTGAYEQELDQIARLEKEFIDAEYDKVKIAKWRNAELKKLNDRKDAGDFDNDNLKEQTDGAIEVFTGFRHTVQSEMSGLFTDTLRGELDNFEDYFSSFTDSLISMWGSAMSQMVMKKLTAQTAQGNDKASTATGAGASFAQMGVVGLALSGVSYAVNKRKKQKAKREQERQQREALQSQLDERIAGLELNDLDKAIFDMNKSFEESAKQARACKLPLDEIIKLRKLETEEIIKQSRERYESLNQDISDWLTDRDRKGWGVSDWENEYGNLGNQLTVLDPASKSYQDDSIKILTDQWEALKTIIDIQENQYNSLESTSESLSSQIWGLQHSEQMPVTAADYQTRYDELLSAAIATGDDGYSDAQAIADFQSFTGDYINQMASEGTQGSYSDLVNTVVGDLTDIQVNVQSEMEMLAEAIDGNTTALDGDDGATSAIKKLESTIKDIADKESYNSWVKTEPSPMKSSEAFNAEFYGGLKEYDLHWTPFDPVSTHRIHKTPPYKKLLEMDNDTLPMINWANDLDVDFEKHPELKTWVDAINAVGYNALESGEALDTNSDGRIQNEEFEKYFISKMEKYKLLLNLFENMPQFSHGGLMTGPSIAGEAGHEWAVPAYYNSNNENFIRSVGIDKIVAAFEAKQTQSGEIHVHLNIEVNNPGATGREIAQTIIDQLRGHPELQESIRRAAAYA